MPLFEFESASSRIAGSKGMVDMNDLALAGWMRASWLHCEDTH